MKRLIATTTALCFGLAVGYGTRQALASRNSSGTYALPAGNPAVPNTLITSSQWNSNFSDLGNEVTNSLCRASDSCGGMLAHWRGIDGTLAAPAYSYTSETGTGDYRAGAANECRSVTGTQVQCWTPAGSSVTGTLAASGAVTGASYSGGPITGTTGSFSGAVTLSGLATLNGGLTIGPASTISAGSNKILNVVDPSGAQDAATKNYVDTTSTPINRAARAWAFLTAGAAGAVTVTKGFNVASATYSGFNLTVTFTSALADANFAQLINVEGCVIVGCFMVPQGTRSTTTTIIFKENGSGTGQNWVNGDTVNLVIFD